MKNIVIFGTGGFAREVTSFLNADSSYCVAGYIDSASSKAGAKINDIPILGSDDVLSSLAERDIHLAFIAIGDVSTRSILADKVRSNNLELITIIHPSAVVDSDVPIGKGVIIYPNVTVNAGVRIGDGVLINSNASIGHDTQIGNFVNINPGASVAGSVTIGDHAFLGIGCSVLEKIEIGSEAVIGGGALVRENVAPGVKVVGVPAKPLASPSHQRDRK